MLALTRRTGESIVIGGLDGNSPLVTVTLLEIRDGRIRLGFTGSSEIPIHREEVWIRLQPPGTDLITPMLERKALTNGTAAP